MYVETSCKFGSARSDQWFNFLDDVFFPTNMLQSILLFFCFFTESEGERFCHILPSSYIGSNNNLYYGTEGVAFYVSNLKNTFVLYLQKEISFSIQSLNSIPWNDLKKL